MVILDCFQPAFGVWIVHKHRVTGELLGPRVDMGTPTSAVLAAKEDRGWRALSEAECCAYNEVMAALESGAMLH